MENGNFLILLAANAVDKLGVFQGGSVLLWEFLGD